MFGDCVRKERIASRESLISTDISISRDLG
jgi:hypothetical protein